MADKNVSRKDYIKAGVLIILFLFGLYLFLFSGDIVYAGSSGTCGANGDNCTWILDDNGSLFINGSGAMYDYSSKYSSGHYSSTAPWYSNRSTIKNVIISSGVTRIGNYAFYGCYNISSVVIANTVRNIGDYSFQKCDGLSAVSIPNGVIGIGRNAFSECSNLKSVYIADSVTTIGKSAFYECSALSLVSISKNVTVIDEYLFSKCSSLISIIIPSKVTRIEKYAFAWCDNISSIKLPEGLGQIGEDAFYGCTNLKDINLPDSIKTIGNLAFSQCNELLSADIPDGVTTISSGLYSGSNGIKTIYIPMGVKVIGRGAFNKCSELTSVIIPESTTSIENTAFWECTNLKSIYIPSSVVTFGDDVIPLTSVVFTTPGSAADQYAKEKGIVRHYISEEYMMFTSESVHVSPMSTVHLADYFVSDKSLTDCTVLLSDNNNFAYGDGMIVNLDQGECLVTVTSGEMSASMKIIASENTSDIQSISFTEKEVTFYKGMKMANPVSVSPETADISSVKWSSSNSAVVSVNKGIVTAVKTGDAIITAKSVSDDSINDQYTVHVVQPLWDIIGDPNMSVEVGEQESYRFYTVPGDTSDNISFSTNSDNISVDSNGVITAIKPGEAEITLTSNKINKTFPLFVTNKATGLSIDPKTARVEATKTQQLNVLFEPEDTTQRDVVWSTDKAWIATVDQNGLVTAHDNGVATITARLGDFKAECTVVCPEVEMEGISIENNHTIVIGDVYYPEVQFIPETTTDDKTVTWAVRDEDKSKIKITTDGGVLALKAGQAIITATVGGFTAEGTITVEKKIPEYTLPDPIQGTCGNKLSQYSLPYRFSWENPDQTIGPDGTRYYKAYYTPSDTSNYQVVHNIDIEFQVQHCGWSYDKDGHWKNCACGYDIAKTSHDYGDWVTTTSPTQTTTGRKRRTCTVCGYIEYATIGVLTTYISTPEDLYNIRNNAGGTFQLTKDLDMSAVTSQGGKYYNSGYGWEPIKSFSGVLDGNGYSIKGLNCAGPRWSWYSSVSGLFEDNQGTIKNLKMKDGTISGDVLNGGSISAINHGLIESCESFGTVSLSVEGQHYDQNSAGGITGHNYGTINNCVNRGVVTIEGKADYYNHEKPSVYAGGVAGMNDGRISGKNYGSVTANTVKASVYAGGITGINNSNTECLVEDSLNEGEISATFNGNYSYYNEDKDYDSYAGGITGFTNGKIATSVNRGNVTSHLYAGGVTGMLDGSSVSQCCNVSNAVIKSEYCGGGIAGASKGSINDCFNTGLLQVYQVYEGDTYTGGITGINHKQGIIKNVYHAGALIGIINKAGLIVGENDGSISKTAIACNLSACDTVGSGTVSGTTLSFRDMKKREKFTYFDFSDIWMMDTGNYKLPVLKSCVEAIDLGDFTIPVNTIVFSVLKSRYNYTGYRIGPEPIQAALTYGEDFTCEYSNNIDAGKAMIIVKGLGPFVGTTEVYFTIDPIMIPDFIMNDEGDKVYNGSKYCPEVTVGSYMGKELIRDKDYTVKYKNNTNAGTATVIVSGKGSYIGSKKAEFKIKPAANKMSAKGKSATVKYSKLKKKNQKIAAKKAFQVKKAHGKPIYIVKKYDRKAKKKITVSKSGKVTIKKGLKKGKYRLTVKVTDSRNKNYIAVTKTVKLVVRVK